MARLLQRLRNQASTERQRWLQHFKFDDTGVFLFQDVALPEPENPKKKLLSEVERAVLTAISEPKRPRLLH